MSVSMLRDVILPEAFNKDGTTFVECEFNSDNEGKNQIQSSIISLTVTVTKEARRVKIPLVVKFEPFNLKMRKYFITNIQFHNEVFMYSSVLPFLDKMNIVEDTFVKFYHGVGVIEDTDRNVVILEDMAPSGYKLANNKVYLDYDHLALTMSKLGRFHALSYAAKTKDINELLYLAHQLKEAIWADGFPIPLMLKYTYRRAIHPLIKQGKNVEILEKVLDHVEHPYIFMHELIKPEEPLAVICHGDFCRSNLLFKYGDDGKPLDVKFIDLGTSRYTSPAVDITVLLLLNSSSDVRQAHWDDLLKVYQSSLSNTIPGNEVPSLDDLKKEVLQRAMYAFSVSSFFLPITLFEVCLDSWEFVPNVPFPEYMSILNRIGGEEGTEVLSNLVEGMIDRGCLTMDHKFMRSSP